MFATARVKSSETHILNFALFLYFEGVGIDSAGTNSKIDLIREPGKVVSLRDKIESRRADLDLDKVLDVHVGIAHTRWATHGEPSERNSHPQPSGDDNRFIVVHNGIITNYKDIKTFLETKGFRFESETDTEVIAKLIAHIHDGHPQDTFR